MITVPTKYSLDKEQPSLYRRRLLAASGFVAIAGCIESDQEDTDPPEDDTDSDEEAADDEGDEGEGDDEVDTHEEPEEPPETVADGFDVDAALEATANALYETGFSIGQWTLSSEGSEADTPDRYPQSTAYGARGEPSAELARWRRAGTQTDELAGIDLNNDIEQRLEMDDDGSVEGDRFFDAGEVFLGPPDDDEESSDTQVGEEEYEDFLRSIERHLESYHDLGTRMVFDDPHWDAEKGVYLVEAERLEEDSPEPEGTEIESCTVEVDTAGVVVSISSEIESPAEILEQEAVGEYGEDISVPRPDWLE